MDECYTIESFKIRKPSRDLLETAEFELAVKGKAVRTLKAAYLNALKCAPPKRPATYLAQRTPPPEQQAIQRVFQRAVRRYYIALFDYFPPKEPGYDCKWCSPHEGYTAAFPLEDTQGKMTIPGDKGIYFVATIKGGPNPWQCEASDMLSSHQGGKLSTSELNYDDLTGICQLVFDKETFRASRQVAIRSISTPVPSKLTYDQLLEKYHSLIDKEISDSLSTLEKNQLKWIEQQLEANESEDLRLLEKREQEFETSELRELRELNKKIEQLLQKEK